MHVFSCINFSILRSCLLLASSRAQCVHRQCKPLPPLSTSYLPPVLPLSPFQAPSPAQPPPAQHHPRKPSPPILTHSLGWRMGISTACLSSCFTNLQAMVPVNWCLHALYTTFHDTMHVLHVKHVLWSGNQPPGLLVQQANQASPLLPHTRHSPPCSAMQLHAAPCTALTRDPPRQPASHAPASGSPAPLP